MSNKKGSEQTLESYETCCLGECFLPNIETKEEFLDILELTYRICKHSLSLPCHQPETNEVVHKNMRMGIGLTGTLQASEEQRSWMNEGYEYLREFDREYSAANGFPRSIKLTTIKPSGCIVENSVLITSRGILTLAEIGNVKGAKWQDHNIQVVQDIKSEASTKFYINGEAEIFIITLDSGIELKCTINHKYRKLTSTGEYIWSKAIDLEPGDKLPYRVGGYENDIYPKLQIIDSLKITQSNFMSEDLAYFLGTYYADGSVHEQGIRISGNKTTKFENLQYLLVLAKNLFDIEGHLIGRKDQDISLDLYFYSRDLLKWLAKNNLIKQKSGDIEVPLIIRQSPASVIKSFIDGYFAGDGHRHKSSGVMTFTTISKTFSQQLPIVMRAIGIDAKVRDMPPTESSYGENMRYWISERKGRNANPRYLPRETRQDWKYLDELGLYDFSVDKIVKIEVSEAETYDIEVPVGNCYVSNSYISHNTLSLLPGVTAGCHPGYSQYMYRRIRIDSSHELVDVCRAHGYPVEYQINFEGKEDYNTVVVTFPFSYPEGTKLAKDMTAIDQLNEVRYLQKNWSDNSVSCTIYYKKEELPAIKKYLNKYYKDNHKSLSFLLHSDHGFAQAPYSEITKEQYDELVERTTIITSISTAEFEGLDECASGQCPIK